MTQTSCDSCGMPLESAADHALGDVENSHCRHCAPDGVLQPFEERFERMVQWTVRSEGVDRSIAETRTRDYMRQMPAWRDHPALA
jgi:Putative zinc ribbon domain